MKTAEVHPALQVLLNPLMRHVTPTRDRDQIIEVSINRPGEVWVTHAERGRRAVADGDITLDWAWTALRALANLRGVKFSDALPVIACQLPGGHRLQAMLGPNIDSGIALSIRVARGVRHSITEFDAAPEIYDHIIAAVQAGHPILISGGTSTGKTSLLRALISYIPRERRIITVEDVNEIDLPDHPNRVHVELARHAAGDNHVTYSVVLDNILRWAPDVVIPGELAPDNAEAAYRLLNTGHGGFISTVHANSPVDALEAWRRNYAMKTGRAGDDVVRFLARTLSCIVQLVREPQADGTDRRRIATVAARGADGTLDIPWRDLLA